MENVWISHHCRACEKGVMTIDLSYSSYYFKVDEALCLNDQAGPLELRGVFCCLTMANTPELVKAKMAITSKKSLLLLVPW